MIKIIVHIGVALVAFALALVGVIAATGNLSNIGKLFGDEPPGAQVAEEKPDEVSAWVRELKKREEDVAEREAAVAESEKQLQIGLQDLEKLRAELAETQEQILETLGAEDEDRQQRLDQVAKSLESMSPENAAESLDKLPEQDAASLIPLITERKRGKILDSMDATKRTLLLRMIEERKF